MLESDDRGECNRLQRVKEPGQETSAKFRRVWTMRRLDIDGTAQTITFEIKVCRHCIRTYDKRGGVPLVARRVRKRRSM